MPMVYNHQKLKGRIRERNLSDSKVASLIGISYTTFSKKMNSKVNFTQTEILNMIEILEIPTSDIKDYFFKPE